MFDLVGLIFSVFLFIVAFTIVRRWEKEKVLGKTFILILKTLYFGGVIFGLFLIFYQLIYNVKL
tara:strand:+ start:497 stop:688 length:192 start_codon:yes stop_codon:yes gene_type:complete